MVGAPPGVIVVGAGLAGLAAAVELAGEGLPVTVLEARPHAGGATYSAADGRLDLPVDNGQHVVLRCCSYYLDFLRRIGARDAVWMQRSLDVPVLDEVGREARLRAAPLPAPLHLVPSLLAYRHCSRPARLRILRAAAAIQRLGETERLQADAVTFAQWLHDRGQQDEEVARFWELILLPTCNAYAGEVSAALALNVLRMGFFEDRRAADIGAPVLGLSEAHVDPAVAWLRARRAQVRLRARVATVEPGEGGALVRLADGETLVGLAVLAVPHDRLAGLLPPAWAQERWLAPALGLPTAPIVNVTLRFDRPVTETDFLACLDPETQWVFNTGRLRDDPVLDGRVLTVSLSAARDALELPERALVERTVAALRRVLLSAREARLVTWRVRKEPHATFVGRPGCEHARPGPVTPAPGVYLAGAWTATGWPATMESAVRSGVAAARQLLRDLRVQGAPMRERERGGGRRGTRPQARRE